MAPSRLLWKPAGNSCSSFFSRRIARARWFPPGTSTIDPCGPSCWEDVNLALGHDAPGLFRLFHTYNSYGSGTSETERALGCVKKQLESHTGPLDDETVKALTRVAWAGLSEESFCVRPDSSGVEKAGLGAIFSEYINQCVLPVSWPQTLFPRRPQRQQQPPR